MAPPSRILATSSSNNSSFTSFCFHGYIPTVSRPWCVCYLPRGVLCTASRRRISAEEIPPSVLCRARERSISAMNRGWVLSVVVSKSAFSTDTNAAIGFPPTVSIIGSLPTSRAYSASEAVASAKSSVFIDQQNQGDFRSLTQETSEVLRPLTPRAASTPPPGGTPRSDPASARGTPASSPCRCPSRTGSAGGNSSRSAGWRDRPRPPA